MVVFSDEVAVDAIPRKDFDLVVPVEAVNAEADVALLGNKLPTNWRRMHSLNAALL